MSVKLPRPQDVTAAEFNVWTTALRMGVGSHAEVARMLRTTTVTYTRWRESEVVRPWWWRSVMNDIVTIVALTHRTEITRARNGSIRQIDARRRLRSMERHLNDNLEPHVWDAIIPKHTLSGAAAEARAFLIRELSSGPVASKRLHTLARKAGIAPVTLSRAAAHMNVAKVGTGFGAERVVEWRLISDD